MHQLTKTESLAHQKTVIELSKDREYFGLFMEQGTGKTHVTIAHLVHLFREGKINGVLVLAPNGVHDNWAKNEIPLHANLSPDEHRVAIWHANDGVRKQDTFAWAIHETPKEQLLIVLANIEAVRAGRFIPAIRRFLDERRFMLVIDESTVIKNPKAAQTRAVMRLAKAAAYRRILTGTPVTQGPLDVWSQCHVLSPLALPYPSFTAFRWEFAIEKEMIMGQRRFKTVIGYKNLDRLAELLKPFTFRVTKAECLDLPPKVYETRYVELTSEQKNLYRTLVKQCLVQFETGQMVTTTMALTQLLRLHQITLGYVTTDEGVIHPIPSNRINVLMDLIAEMQGKTIVFCRFKEDVHRVCGALLNEGKIAQEYSGDINAHDRHEAITEFQEGDLQFLVATRAAARGLTLHAASNVVYYSQGFSLEDRLQSEDRAHRIGQTKSVLYVDLVARGTIDEKVLLALKAKQDVASMVIGPKEFAQLAELMD